MMLHISVYEINYMDNKQLDWHFVRLNSTATVLYSSLFLENKKYSKFIQTILKWS
eukprot:m.67046 g.67046  ORF g.67046 m.67046 type:complete len:55 (+) comp11854_c0_seq1:71-235(+)